MDTELIIINEYCTYNSIDPEFIYDLEREGLIELIKTEQQYCISTTQLPRLERYRRLHHDLAVNVQGIAVINELMERMEQMEAELARVRQMLQLLDLDE